jgi:hypothetical protein
MTPSKYRQFIQFLTEELNISNTSINLAEKVQVQFDGQADTNLGFLPMILWQYGLVTLEQLDKIFDWMETAH